MSGPVGVRNRQFRQRRNQPQPPLPPKLVVLKSDFAGQDREPGLSSKGSNYVMAVVGDDGKLNPSTAERVLRILIADEREWMRRRIIEVVHRTLPAAAVIDTSDGSQAYRAYEHGGCHLLLTNHQMPGMDGLTLIRQVRRRSATLPVWMIANEPEAERDALVAGATGFLRNETVTTDLPALLRQHLEQAG